jgi:1,4-dihydroxy-2-naphthoyl-CoA synthase
MNTTESNQVIYEVSQGIAQITLNRPDKLNSLTEKMHHDLRWALDCVDYEHLITVTYICYSINSGRRSLSGEAAGMGYLVRRYRFKTVDDYTLWAEGRLARCE